MFEITLNDLLKLKISTRMIVKELLARGFRVYGFYSTSGLLQVEIPEHPIPMRLFSVIDESMSFIAGRSVAGNKQVTNALLAHKNILVPKELYVGFSEIDERSDEINAFIDEHKMVVAKPIDGAHGNGVVVGLTDIEKIKAHAQKIDPSSRFDGFIIQQQLVGHDIRIVCINNTFASAMTRIPASIVGDGTHTIEQLIELENQNPERGENYGTAFNRINIDHVKSFLSQQELERIPSNQEYIQVAGISNVGVGGIRQNIDESIPPFLAELAETIAKEMRLPVCGIDFFVDRLPTQQDTLEDLHPVLIEVNNCPGLTMYESFDDPRQKRLLSLLVDSQIAAHYRQYPL